MSAYQSSVVGLAYEARGDYIRQNVIPGDALTLRAEPENRYDADAVAVFHKWQKIGFVPAGSQWLAEALASGLVLEVVAGQLEYDEFAIPVILPIEVTLLEEPVPTKVAIRSAPVPDNQLSRSNQKKPGYKRVVVIALLVFVIVALIYVARTYAEAAVSLPI